MIVYLLRDKITTVGDKAGKGPTDILKTRPKAYNWPAQYSIEYESQVAQLFMLGG